MKFRNVVVSSLALGALLLPSAASATDVHITIGFSHVQRDSGRKLRVAGELHLYSGSSASCSQNRHVAVQRKKSAGWKTIAHANSNDNGAYKKLVADRAGRYRVVAPATASCERDVSEVKRHSH